MTWSKPIGIALATLGALVLGACTTPAPQSLPASLGADSAAACAAMTAQVPSSVFGLPSGAATIESAALVPETALAVAERGPTPAARITPQTPAFCRVLGRIAPVDPSAPPIRFQVNLPLKWNGRTVQYGGGGFNGTLITGLALIPAARFDQPAPLAQGYVTYGTDSGHQTGQAQPPQAFALNDEALLNFAHASYKKVRDVAAALVQGWGVSGEATPPFGPTGGWSAWWLGAASPAIPPQPNNGIAWIYGSGAIQYFYARDPNFDVRRYKPEDFAPRVREISALMDSTNPDLSAFHARGGKLLMLENMADYAQSPYAGIGYYESVVARLGKGTVDQFIRLYTAPGVDHVGSGAPANVDMLSALVDWVEHGRAPGGLQIVEQAVQAPFGVTKARPLCEWPLWPRYKGGGAAQASSFECTQ